MLLGSVYCLFGVCYIFYLPLLFDVFCCCCYYFNMLVYPTTVQISICYGCISLVHDMYSWLIIMYSCLLSMNFVILCVTVYFTMFCKI